MAGSYPDVPGYRFAYDVDGTVVVLHVTSDGTNAQRTAADLRSLNSDTYSELADGGLLYGGTKIHAFIFPEPRSVTGLLYRTNQGTLQGASWSGNTTDGIDGTWTTIPGFASISSGTKALLRSSITPLSLTNVKCIQFQQSGNGSSRIRNVHIYGSITPTASPDRLRIIDMSSNDMVAQLDFGNLTQRASTTRQFKVVNNSMALTASSITVSLDAPTDANPSLIGQYQVSTDNVSFANAVNIGTLAPGVESGTMYVRLNPASNAQLSLWSARIIAHAVSWS